MLKIVSGGQTGVDRAALDVAIDKGLPYGGWCPKGGWAEDLPEAPGLLALYAGLRETPERSPRQRTEWNIRDSDRFLVVVDQSGLAASKGSEQAVDFADRLARPHIVIDVDWAGAVLQARTWLSGGLPDMTLCIGGPRESEAPGIYAKAKAFLHAVLGP
jgi:hypothetical protein